MSSIQRDLNALSKEIFEISSKSHFTHLALKIFKLQYELVDIYHRYCQMLGKSPDNVLDLYSIPFLPIEFFKTETIILSGLESEMTFKSSGTQNKQKRSEHHVSDLILYQNSFNATFDQFILNRFGFRYFSLLPSYEENSDSSLLYMVNHIIKNSGQKTTFKFDNDQELCAALIKSKKQKESSLLFGVSFALLDFAEKYSLELPNTVIFETGGMKGRRNELTRVELHALIEKKLKPKSIISEYGMTELLSQAYAKNDNAFLCPPWMKVFIRDIHDPLSLIHKGTGGINIIDLCNLNSCAFIATSDLGKINEDGGFEVLGRFDHSDIRGCNLLYEFN